MKYKLLTYRPEPSKARGENPAFFIQNRGNNSGRPTKTPLTNCFALYCDKDDAEPLYYMFYCLWAGKRFFRYLRGSVIPFIVKKELCAEVDRCLSMAQNRSFYKAYKQIRAAEEQEKVIAQQKRLLQELKQVSVAQFLYSSNL